MPVLPCASVRAHAFFAAYPAPDPEPLRRIALSSRSSRSLYGQGFRRSCSSTATAATIPAAGRGVERSARRRADDLEQLVERTAPVAGRRAIDPDASHASWLENFPWTRLAGVDHSPGRKPMADIAQMRESDPHEVRKLHGDGSLGASTSVRRGRARVWQRGRRGGARPDRGRLVACLTSSAARPCHWDCAGHRRRDRRGARSIRRHRAQSRSRQRRCLRPRAGGGAEKSQIGRVDIFVNNAGGVVGQVGRPLEDVSDDDGRRSVTRT